MQTKRWIYVLALAGIAVVSGNGSPPQAVAASHETGGTRLAQYNQQGIQRDQSRARWRRDRNFRNRGVTVPQGTSVAVTINTPINTATANVGDRWTGVTENDVIVGNRVAIPAGTPVLGTVTESRIAENSNRAILGLGLESMTRNGRTVSLPGSTPSIEAGSSRARSLGFIAGGAAAGAIVGHAVTKSSKGSWIGALLGGLTGGAMTRGHKSNVEVEPGETTVEFVIDEPVAVDMNMRRSQY